MKIKIFASFILILVGVAGRIFLVEFIAIPNLEIITAIALISGVILGGFFTFFIPLSIIVISDFYFGNNSIILFTWSAFIFIGFLCYCFTCYK